MSFPFREVAKQDKQVIGQPRWSEPEGVDQRLRLVAPLLFKGRAMQGLELVGRAHADLRNLDVSFRLLYHPTNVRRDAVQIAGVDWRAKTPHSNEHANTPPELLGDVGKCHYHSFDLNWSKQSGRPLSGLPIAEITTDFQTFNELIDGLRQMLRISNASAAVRSPWPKDLFNAAS